MKAKIEFDLEDLDDVISHLRCVKAEDMAKALSKIKNISKDNWTFNVSEMQSKIEDLINEK